MDPKDFPSRRAGQLVRSEASDWCFLPHSLPPDLQYSDSLVGALASAQHVLGELAGLGQRVANPRLFYRPLIRQEAASSSRIEGTYATMQDVLISEAGAKPKSPPDPEAMDVQLVRNYADALEYGLRQLRTKPIDLSYIYELHSRLMTGMRGDIFEPGIVRDEQNFIGGGHRIEDAIFVPPPPERIQALLISFEKYILTTSTHPALLRIALVHYQFEAIHPFLDGNGRVGRLLSTLLVIHWGLLPNPILNLSVYFEKNRQEYMRRLLSVSQKGEWEEWILFFLQGVNMQAPKTIQVLQKLEDLRKKWQEQTTKPRSPGRMLMAIDFLFATPVFRIPQLQKALKLQYPSAERIVAILTDEGILEEQTGQARNRMYAAKGVLRLLEENSN
jgi:Fic family protein